MCVKEFADDEPYKFNLKSSLGYTYENGTNRLNRITAKTELGENVLDVGYKNPKDGHMPDAIYSEWWNGSWTRSYNYDDLGRLYTADTRTTELTWLKSEYTYRTISGNRTTSQVSSLETEAGTYSYTYDSRGNISSVSDGTYTTTYTYDNLNQLTRENNQKLGKTYVYTYSNGNITSRKEYAYTTGTLGTAAKTDTFTYTAYSWGDILVAYNGEYFGYTDAKMNSFQGKALTWHYLGLLGSAGSTSFTYDTSGRRLSKTTGGTTTNYYYAGDMLVGQKTGNNELEFMFDSSGDYFGFTYNGTAYYYIKNLQGDVISIFNANGNEVATYTYDAWGRTLATTDTSGVNISAINPIRYRGYYYDTETGFYFLQTRYYVPEICRFLSADGAISEVGGEVLGYNQFAYCFNNPVNMDDSTGNWPKWIEKIGGRIVNTVKVISRIAISPFKAITIKVGGGIGLGAKVSTNIKNIPVEIGAIGSITDSILLDKGTFDVRNASTVNFGVTFADTINYSYSKGYDHSYFDDNCSCNFMSTSFGEKNKCIANTDVLPYEGTLGLSVGAYFMLGAEVSINIDLYEWNNELIDIFNENDAFVQNGG